MKSEVRNIIHKNINRMEIETLQLVHKRPPLPKKKSNKVSSETTLDSSDSQPGEREKGKNIKEKVKQSPRFPPLHLPRCASLSRNSSQTKISMNLNRSSSKERIPTKESIRQSTSCRRPSSIGRFQSEEAIQSQENGKLFVPNVSAHSWIIYEMNKGKYIHGKRIHKVREMASLTKIMNLITAIQIIQELNINPSKMIVRVSKHASKMPGTSASLKVGMELSLLDLFFGMMLPSGNDAAFCVAQYLGSILTETENLGNTIYDVDKLDRLRLSKKNPVWKYLELMNNLSKRLKMFNSRFTNSHGLSQNTNTSTAEDLAKLCTYSMKNKLFVNIVNTKQHKAYTKIKIQQPLEEQQTDDFVEYEKQIVLSWMNTNKMLWEGWSGVKTGVTPNAGPCLAAAVQKVVNGQHYHLLVILLSSASMDVRWKQVKQIANWAVTQNLIY